ncbi:uncharacterized protein LOC111025671 [Momordica charantia]|uniref:Uncharacterized protein LOC111025671 n=1 Tax=Momordica charantia TaxID=3673 RepID=A0A6J1E1X0_MOMCH|nr:uncharacterized protein LOC111025671 [Momordica charantia]
MLYCCRIIHVMPMIYFSSFPSNISKIIRYELRLKSNRWCTYDRHILRQDSLVLGGQKPACRELVAPPLIKSLEYFGATSPSFVDPSLITFTIKQLWFLDKMKTRDKKKKRKYYQISDIFFSHIKRHRFVNHIVPL